MTDEMERQVEEVFAHLLELGGGSILEGVYEGIESGWFVSRIADSAYRFEQEVNAGRRIIVGVNAFTDGNEDVADDALRIDPAVEEYQLRRLANAKSERDPEALAAALTALETCAADPARNLMPPLIDAVAAYATEGEIVGALEAVFGTYVEKIVV
jgi:methylmalonyl-CoA mutase N-terminal domain/subunit